MKRGQSALEYLVTYGWAVLAVVIIAGVLWYFGIFNPTRFLSSKQCGGFGSFVCQDFKVNTTGWLTIVLNNNAGGTLNNVNITMLGGQSCAPASVAANQNVTCTDNLTANGLANGVSGNTFLQQSISLGYIDSRSGITHNDTGFINGKYE